MKQPLFRFAPLAAGVVAAFTIPVNASLLDEAAAPVTVHELENVSRHRFSGYDVATQPDGGFAVIWAVDYNYQDYEDSVVLQRFDASGNANGDALTLYQKDVSQGTFQFKAPAVAADEDGDLVVAWTTPGDHCFGDLFIQTLAVDSDWSNLPEPTLVSEEGCEPKLAVDADGDFALTWRDRAGLGYQDANALLRTYSANGVPLQDQPLVLVHENANTVETPAIAMQPDHCF